MQLLLETARRPGGLKKGKAWTYPYRSFEGYPNPDAHVSEFPMTYSNPDKGQEKAMRVLETESKIFIRDRVRQFLWNLLQQTVGFLVHAQLRTRAAAFLNLYSPFEALVVHEIQDV